MTTSAGKPSSKAAAQAPFPRELRPLIIQDETDRWYVTLLGENTCDTFDEIISAGPIASVVAEDRSPIYDLALSRIEFLHIKLRSRADCVRTQKRSRHDVDRTIRNRIVRRIEI